MSPLRAQWLAVVLTVAMPATPALAQGFVVLKNSANPTKQLSKAELAKLLLGQNKQWPAGAVVQVILPREGSEALKSLSQKLFGVSDKVLLSKMKQEVFKGELRRPVTAEGAAAADAVKENPGGLAVVDEKTAASLPAGVEALSVQLD